MTTVSTSPAASPAPKTVLVVDDEKNIRRTLQLVLEGKGYNVLGAETAEQALTILGSPETPVDLAILDVKLPQMSGLEALERVRKDDAVKDTPIIVISGHASVSDAVSAIKLGASDFFEKPLNRERVLVSVKNVLEAEKTRRALAEVSRHELQKYEMIGRAPAMRKLFHEIEKVAPTKAGVLITGESGTGKEPISRAIHRLSPRDDGPFIKVNCAAIPRELIESELLVTSAARSRLGRKRGFFEQAHGGTLFLDEIGDMDLVAQAKVLRALQSGEISRVGSEHVMHVDVRVLAATNKDLDKAVERQTFREDLFFRLNVFPLRSPSLRERVEDIPVLAEAFMVGFSRENGTKPKPIDADVVTALVARKWPGNVRELKNVVERMAILSGDRVTIADLPEDPHDSPFGEDESPADTGTPSGDTDYEGPSEPTGSGNRASGPPPGHLTLREHREKSERQYIVDTLKMTGWNISRTAIVLGVERTNLHKKIRAYSIKRGEG